MRKRERKKGVPPVPAIYDYVSVILMGFHGSIHYRPISLREISLTILLKSTLLSTKSQTLTFSKYFDLDSREDPFNN